MHRYGLMDLNIFCLFICVVVILTDAQTAHIYPTVTSPSWQPSFFDTASPPACVYPYLPQTLSSN